MGDRSCRLKAKRIPRARQRQNRRGPAYPASRRQRYSCHRKKSHNEAGETPLRLLSFVKVSPPSLRTVADEGNRVFAAIRARARARDRRADPGGRTKAFNRRPEQSVLSEIVRAAWAAGRRGRDLERGMPCPLLMPPVERSTFGYHRRLPRFLWIGTPSGSVIAKL